MKIFYYSLLFVLGTCLASFITLVGMRLPINQSIITPRSHCDQCHKILSWYELIPILGYLINRGKCSHCGCFIPWYLPVNELLLGCSFTYIMITKADGLFRAVLLLLLLLFATMDHFYGIIMPIIFVPSFLILVILHPNIALDNFFAIFISLAAFSFISKGLGFGDVEIIGFLGLFLSLYNCLVILLLSCLLCLIIEIYKQNFDKPINFVPYIYWVATGVMIFN